MTMKWLLIAFNLFNNNGELRAVSVYETGSECKNAVEETIKWKTKSDKTDYFCVLIGPND